MSDGERVYQPDAPPGQHYPERASEVVMASAHSRFAEKVPEYGEGKNWRGALPGAMLVEAHRKLAEAHMHVIAEEPEAATDALGDVLNYLVFEVDARMAAENGDRDE